MNTSIFTDPIKFGPGLWFKIHMDAISTNTDQLKNSYIININTLCDNFKCKHCQTHFRKFIDSHDFKKYWNIYNSKGEDIGFFKWSWELHNNVNRFLKKYEPSFEEAYNFYFNPDIGICTTCNGNSTKNFDKDPNRKKLPDFLDEKNISELFGSRIDTSKVNVPPILTKYVENKNFQQPFRIISRQR